MNGNSVFDLNVERYLPGAVLEVFLALQLCEQDMEV
jgi:hypothetical protein